MDSPASMGSAHREQKAEGVIISLTACPFINGDAESVRPLQRVMLCDPRPAYRERLAGALAPHDSALAVPDLESLARSCQQGEVAVAALPLYWPLGSSPASTDNMAPVVQLLETHGRHAALVVYADTDRVSTDDYCRALRAGARQVVNEGSPTLAADLQEVLGRLLHHQQAHADEQQQLAGLFAAHGLVGGSAALKEVFAKVVRASTFSDLPVLLLGEPAPANNGWPRPSTTWTPAGATNPLAP